MQQKKEPNIDLYRKMKELISPSALQLTPASKNILQLEQKNEVVAPPLDPFVENDRKELSNFHFQGRLSREELKHQISAKNKALQDLNLNRQFFEKELVNKIDRFKEDLKEIKPQVFDKTFKSNLHYIYKHYENFRNGMPPYQAQEILKANLTKQHTEIEELRKKNSEVNHTNKMGEQQLLERATHEGLIKKKSNVFDKMTKHEIELQIKIVENDNIEIENKLNEIKKNRDNELMKLQIQMEKKGRNGMEKRAIKLALAHANDEDTSLANLKYSVKLADDHIENLQKVKKNHSYFQLEKKRQQLLEKLNHIRIVS